MDGRSVLGGVALGVALTLMLDPSRGGRRRAIARDRAARCTRQARRAIDAAWTDVSNRVIGLVATTRARFQTEEIDDTRLLERVRAKLGRVCSHPRALDVDVRDGEVALRGPIFSDEVSDVLTATASVRGVHAVVNALEPHDSADGVPSLQGAGGLAGPALDMLQEHWAPATRALVGLAALAAGGVAMAACARR